MVKPVEIHPINDVFVRIHCEPLIAKKLDRHFSFAVEGARFSPHFGRGGWDGRIHLFSKTHLLYRGLWEKARDYIKELGVECILAPGLITLHPKLDEHDFDLPSHLELRDYQVEAFQWCVIKDRALIILPTGSGKSLVIYWLVRYYNAKTLIIVDSLNLINQMCSDFKDYGFDSEANMHKISGGKDSNSPKPIYISTWQSAIKRPKEWFEQFNLVIGDECHLFEAKSFRKIMERLTDCPYRFGFTGTLSGTKTNEMIVEGLFGPQRKIITTKKLMDEGHLSTINIKCIVLSYSPEDRKFLENKPYKDELSFLYAHARRNRFIQNLAQSLKGNTLILFHRLEHGSQLANFQDQPSCPVYYVSGEVGGDEREEIRKIVNTHDHSITVASVGVFSKGVNIPNINNIIAASPSKSQVRVLQSIGRGIRKSGTKTHCEVYDIADDLGGNYTIQHFGARKKMYAGEQFPHKIYNIELPK